MKRERISRPCVLPVLRVTADERDRYLAHARGRGETLADFCRRAMDETIRRDHLATRLAETRQAFSGQVFIETPPGA